MENLGKIGELLTGIGTVLLALATIALFYAAWRPAREGVRQYKARWLVDLFDRFYAKEEYRDMYLAFDGSNDLLLARIIKLIGGGTDQEAEWALTRYLNFFELVETLVARREMSQEDVGLVLGYPLTRLAKQPGMIEYLQNNGYRSLHERLARLAPAPPAKSATE